MAKTTEDTLEITVLHWLSELGYQPGYAPDLAPEAIQQERENFQQVVLVGRLRAALQRINPAAPHAAIEEAIEQVINPPTPELMFNNQHFHSLLTDGIDIEVDASIGYGSEYQKIWLLDLDDLDNNDWLALNQFTVIETINGRAKNRRADVVVFVNGIPLAVLELKNPADEKADAYTAHKQLETYKAEIPSLFTTNEVLVASDGVLARAGSLSAGWDRFVPWRTISGSDLHPKGTLELEILIKGMFERHRFLDYILNFVVFENRGKIVKKNAAYHQYWAVNKAISCTFSACGIHADADRLLGRFPPFEEPQFRTKEAQSDYVARKFGDRRIGVIWHTQGSGKSFQMVFLRREDYPSSGHGEPDPGGDHRPQRPG